MSSPFHTLSDNQLVKEIQKAEVIEAEAKKHVKALKDELKARALDNINSELKLKDEPFGTVHVDFGGKDVECVIKKEVEWDQDQLAATHQRMLLDGLSQADIGEYIKISYAVSETKYKSWPNHIKAYFEPARTVKPGSMSIKIKDKE